MVVRWQKAVLYGAVILGALPYLAGCALLYSQQRQLLYPADNRTISDEVLQRSGWKRLSIGGETHAYWREPERQARGTIVLFHGNAGMAMDRTHYAAALLPLGYRVVLAEYPGYGGRQGLPDESALVADARNLLKEVSQRFGGRLFVWGESLGAGVAAAALADVPVLVEGVALLTPWNTLADTARSHYGFLPVGWLLRDRYDSAGNLQAFRGRLAVLIAERDSVIPARLGETLYTSFPGEKRRWIFTGADHNTWPAQPEAAWWGEVMRFLDRQ